MDGSYRSCLFQPYASRYYRSDIQGIRAIGALLILAYHIWGQSVSGGVDVFFVVSGFLMTSVLLRRCAEGGGLAPLQFWAGIVRRVAPSAYLVLLGTLVFGYFFLPPQLWLVTINEMLFSAAHLENFQLMRLSVDYLAKDQPASPYQQFWALSVQVQFYVLLPLIVGLGLFLARKRRSLLPLLATVLAFLLASFAYSLVATYQQPTTAYFNTAARLWEFMAGALVALAMPWLKPSHGHASIASAIALLVLLTTGLVVPNFLNYPGYIAALPVTAAVLLLVSGSVEKKPMATRLLSNRYLVALGGISFTVYLWHWPILVYTQHSLATTELSLLQGMAIIATAVALAALTTAIVENPLRRMKSARLWPSYALGAVFFMAVAMPGLGARERVLLIYEQVESETMPLFRGESIDIQKSAAGVSLEQFLTVGSDKSFPILFCLEDSRACESGDVESDRIVALVGGSHAAQWEPLFSELGKRYGFKLVTMVQMSCALGYQSHMDEACRRYNETIVDRVRDLNPIFVVTNSTRIERSLAGAQAESVPQSYADQWRRITSLGFPVLGIRDNPWFESDPSLCVWNRRHSANQCARPARELYLPEDPSMIYEATIPSFHSADFGPVYCTEGQCPAVFNSRLMYFDNHHLTRSFVIYMGNQLEQLLRSQVPEFFNAVDWQGLELPGEGSNETLGSLGADQ